MNEIQAVQKQLNNEKVQEKFSEILKDQGPSFVASLSTLLTNNELLAKAGTNKIVTAALKAAALDLSVLPDLGEAYVIPYEKKRKVNGKWTTVDVDANLQLGYRGLIKLVQNTGRVGKVAGVEIYAANKPKYNRIYGELSIGNPEYDPDVDEPSEVVGYLAYYYLDGNRIENYWSKKKVLKHVEKFSQSWDPYNKEIRPKSAWGTSFDAMAIKTVIKDLLKFAPKSQQVAKAIADDDRSDRRDITPAEKETVTNETPTINVPEEAVTEADKPNSPTSSPQQTDQNKQDQDTAPNVAPSDVNFEDNAADDFLKGLGY
ncbi:recombinase RecT [Weissella bombi]|uniref:Recombination protein RecT n=1 Tax=Weissella bombi TaxID=1505725 RepID=A0A1C4C117_9LACO|nr:recombinase RecT [Weissella bombi]SCC12768.1 recombination protein RecT [Weissella bombi]